MKKNALWMSFGKFCLCCLAFVVGLFVSGLMLPWIVVWSAWGQFLSYTVGCALLGLPVALLSSRLRLNGIIRWVLLSQLAWLLAAVCMGVEAKFNTAGIVNGLLVYGLNLFGLSLPVVLFSGAAAYLFRPAPQGGALPRVRVAPLAVGQA